MSRGLPRLWNMLFSPLWRDPGRTEELSRHGMAIEIAEIDVSNDPQIVRVNIGFGLEYWLVREIAIDLALDGLGIAQGKLILRDGQRLLDGEVLRSIGLSVVKLLIRI